MKRYLFLFFALAWLPVCSQSIYLENDIRYAGESVEKVYHLDGKKSNPSCRITINFFYPDLYADAYVLDKVQSRFIAEFFGLDYAVFSPKKAVKQYTKDFVRQYRDLYEQSGVFREEEKAARARGEDIRDYVSYYIHERSMRNTILYNRAHVISQVINTYEYTGGAHGLSSTSGVNIDLNTGDLITYDDVFDKSAEAALSDLLLNKLYETYGVNTRAELDELGFYFDELTPSRNFVLDDRGVTFIYGQYEIGPYVLGIIELSLPYEQIHSLIKADSPVRRLFKYWIGKDEQIIINRQQDE
ncbi:DUF3298 and DUF4163 domain-containing protein [Bacteroidales bacterium OttesenSCG-928-L03]|nr:DUF3298 and DUF4163 domain-containing protein [Bacteroidales bacterium OttesenSCG-928-L03]